MGLNSNIILEPSSPIPPIEILHLFLKAGWQYDIYNSISYLPLKDEGMYRWQFSNSDQWEDILKICTLKAEQGEVVGIALTWEETLRGGNFLFHPNSTIEVGLNINRIRLLEGSPYTDFSWYLHKLTHPILERCPLQHINCQDFYP